MKKLTYILALIFIIGFTLFWVIMLLFGFLSAWPLGILGLIGLLLLFVLFCRIFYEHINNKEDQFYSKYVNK